MPHNPCLTTPALRPPPPPPNRSCWRRPVTPSPPPSSTSCGRRCRTARRWEWALGGQVGWSGEAAQSWHVLTVEMPSCIEFQTPVPQHPTSPNNQGSRPSRSHLLYSSNCCPCIRFPAAVGGGCGGGGERLVPCAGLHGRYRHAVRAARLCPHPRLGACRLLRLLLGRPAHRLRGHGRGGGGCAAGRRRGGRRRRAPCPPAVPLPFGERGGHLSRAGGWKGEVVYCPIVVPRGTQWLAGRWHGGQASCIPSPAPGVTLSAAASPAPDAPCRDTKSSYWTS